jgi:hypothetical protein
MQGRNPGLLLIGRCGSFESLFVWEDSGRTEGADPEIWERSLLHGSAVRRRGLNK